jgi:hypothetical protein
MGLIVSDTSTLIHLASIDRLDLEVGRFYASRSGAPGCPDLTTCYNFCWMRRHRRFTGCEALDF